MYFGTNENNCFVIALKIILFQTFGYKKFKIFKNVISLDD